MWAWMRMPRMHKCVGTRSNQPTSQEEEETKNEDEEEEEEEKEEEEGDEESECCSKEQVQTELLQTWIVTMF